MPTNFPPKPKEPKWQPEKDPNPIGQAAQDIADAILTAATGSIIFVPVTFFSIPEEIASHAEYFQLCSLGFMAISAWTSWRIRQ